MKIRYQGGPLDRQSFSGPSTQPAFRDGEGNVVTYEGGEQASIQVVREAADRSVYIYDAQHCTYRFISDVVTNLRSESIRRKLERLEEHPEEAGRIEAEIREIEERSAQLAESAA